MADASNPSNSNALVAEAATSEVLSSPSVGIASPSHNPSNNNGIMHPLTTMAPAPTNSNGGHRDHHLTGANSQTQPILITDEAKSPAATPNRPPKSRRDIHLETMDFAGLLAQHKATKKAVRDAFSSIEAAAARVEHRVKSSSSAAAAAADNNGSGGMMKTKDRRIVWLMVKVILGKDAEILEKVESMLERTQHSMWKLSREMRLISMKRDEGEDIEHEMYELLEGFVMALTGSRGEDRSTWGEDGAELGQILDEIRADMEWWDDGKDD